MIPSMNIGAGVSLSTIGIPEKIRQFSTENLQVNLAVSLHAPNDALRQELVPIASKITVAEIMAACRDYIAATNRRVTFEYVLIEHINDLPQHARELSHLLKGLLCHVNLIGLNPTNHYPGKTPSRQAIRDFGQILLSNHIPTSIRNSQDLTSKCCGSCGGNSNDKLKGKIRA